MIALNPYLLALVALVVVVALGFTGAPLILWALALGAILYLASAPLWLLAAFAAVMLVFLIVPIRRVLVSRLVMKILGPAMPAISETERTAIESGAVWAEGELFSGKPDFRKLMNESYPTLTAEERAFLDGPVDELCAVLDDWEIWERRELPREAWDVIKRHKFLGMIIPKEYGGLGFSALAHSEVILKLASRSLPACITVMVPNSLGPAELLVHYGTDEQKRYLLPRLASGEEIPCFALTEPGAGSDAGSITSNGTLFKGEDGKLYIRLEWNKRYITLAAIATLLGLAFRLRDPENLLGQGEDLGITCALIPTTTPGVVLGRRHDPLFTPFYNCPTQGHDVVVPVDAVVGGVEGCGKGWRMLTESLAAGRGISLPAQSTGGTKLATRVISAYASIRKQFGLPIGKFEGIEEPIARIAGFNYLLDAMRKYTLGAIDSGIKPAVVTAMAKYNATEIGRKVVNDAMDIAGGSGISRGPRNLLAHFYVATPIGITVEGANILTRTLIIFGQGALRAHPYALLEVNAIAARDLAAFDRAFWGHAGHIVRNLTRAIVLSVTRGALAGSPVSGSTARYYRRLSWASATFAIMADVAMGALGGSLKLKEKLTGRYGDILSWMYIGTAVLRRYEAEGRRKEDLPFVHFSMNHALYEIQKAFDGIFANLPVPGLGWFFRGPLRMWSNLNALAGEANDQHTHKIATLILSDTEQRLRHTEGIYMPQNTLEHLSLLDETFRLVKRAEAAEKKVRAAVKAKALPKLKGAASFDAALANGVITQAERDDLGRADELRAEAIEVDSFTQEEYLNHQSPGVLERVHEAEEPLLVDTVA
ncbi:MAG: acyl-CoA dehydrogenase [Acidobacteria bacterium]|nr:acyl-CoA dehydrogenase [Acidobacteriota bacterium]MBV9476589.1 acyl-CoA dehydrogenase [Acidobacteriota bacterium]